MLSRWFGYFYIGFRLPMMRNFQRSNQPSFADSSIVKRLSDTTLVALSDTCILTRSPVIMRNSQTPSR